MGQRRISTESWIELDWAGLAAFLVATLGDAIVVAGGMSLEPMFQPMGSVEVHANETWTLFSDGLPGALPSIAVGLGSGAALNATHMLCGGGAGQGVDGTEAFLFSLA